MGKQEKSDEAILAKALSFHIQNGYTQKDIIQNNKRRTLTPRSKSNRSKRNNQRIEKEVKNNEKWRTPNKEGIN